MVASGRVPLTDPNGKIREVHLPLHLTEEQFDPPVDLVQQFEQTLDD